MPRWLLYNDARLPELYAHEVDGTHTPTGKPVLAARALTGITDIVGGDRNLSMGVVLRPALLPVKQSYACRRSHSAL